MKKKISEEFSKNSLSLNFKEINGYALDCCPFGRTIWLIIKGEYYRYTSVLQQYERSSLGTDTHVRFRQLTEEEFDQEISVWQKLQDTKTDNGKLVLDKKSGVLHDVYIPLVLSTICVEENSFIAQLIDEKIELIIRRQEEIRLENERIEAECQKIATENGFSVVDVRAFGTNQLSKLKTYYQELELAKEKIATLTARERSMLFSQLLYDFNPGRLKALVVLGVHVSEYECLRLDEKKLMEIFQ